MPSISRHFDAVDCYLLFSIIVIRLVVVVVVVVVIVIVIVIVIAMCVLFSRFNKCWVKYSAIGILLGIKLGIKLGNRYFTRHKTRHNWHKTRQSEFYSDFIFFLNRKTITWHKTWQSAFYYGFFFAHARMLRNKGHSAKSWFFLVC